MVSVEMWERAGRICCFCRKPVKRYTAVVRNYGGPELAHPSCYRRAVKEAT